MEWLTAIFLLYKLGALAAGVAFAYMGYRLFLADKIESAGDAQAKFGDFKIIVKRFGPGTFFGLFGAIIVSITIWRGFDLELNSIQETRSPKIMLPEKMPAKDLSGEKGSVK